MAFPSKNEAPSPSEAPAAQEDEDLMGCSQKWVLYPWKSHENLLGGWATSPSEKWWTTRHLGWYIIPNIWKKTEMDDLEVPPF